MGLRPRKPVYSGGGGGVSHWTPVLVPGCDLRAAIKEDRFSVRGHPSNFPRPFVPQRLVYAGPTLRKWPRRERNKMNK